MNVGPPRHPVAVHGSARSGNRTVYPEFLFLVNGLDDNQNGWIDEGYDGVEQQHLVREPEQPARMTPMRSPNGKHEAWPASFVGQAVPTNQPYTIQRRPAPVSNSREISLPTNVVIDLTTWGNPALNLGTQERSQFPPGVINPYTGYVDILLYPNGTVVPTTIYSTPSSFGMSGAFFHFWLAERSDVAISSTNDQRRAADASQPCTCRSATSRSRSRARVTLHRAVAARASIAS